MRTRAAVPARRTRDIDDPPAGTGGRRDRRCSRDGSPGDHPGLAGPPGDCRPVTGGRPDVPLARIRAFRLGCRRPPSSAQKIPHPDRAVVERRSDASTPGGTVARAKKTDRSEARRRARLAPGDPEGAPEGSVFHPGARPQSRPPRAAPTRVAGPASHLRRIPDRAIRPIDPARLTYPPDPPAGDRTNAVWLPSVSEGRRLDRSRFATSGGSPGRPASLAFNLFVFPPPLAAAFLAGILTERMSYLAGGLVGLVSAIVFSAYMLVRPTVPALRRRWPRREGYVLYAIARGLTAERSGDRRVCRLLSPVPAPGQPPGQGRQADRPRAKQTRRPRAASPVPARGPSPRGPLRRIRRSARRPSEPPSDTSPPGFELTDTGRPGRPADLGRRLGQRAGPPRAMTLTPPPPRAGASPSTSSACQPDDRATGPRHPARA